MGVQVLEARALRHHHGTLAERVRRAVEGDAVGGAPVPPRPPALLVVVLHGLAEGVVDHKADVGLVYAHAKGHSGYDDLMGLRREGGREGGREVGLAM